MHQVSMQLLRALVMNDKTDLGEWYVIVWGFQSSFQRSRIHDCRSKI